MRILYVAPKHDYGDPARGLSFEQHNFLDTFRHMGHEVLHFDFPGLLRGRGRRRMNRLLAETVRSERPDVLFAVLANDELDAGTVRRISRSGGARTVNWFCDDHWRFESFTRRWAPAFQWSVTTAQSALPKYAAAGIRNVIKSQWACNPFLYKKLDLPLKYDVSFVGQPHGARKLVIRYLAENGIPVQTWGRGWESGRISQERMIEVFNQSRINLNFTHSVAALPSRWKPVAAARELAASAVARVPGAQALKDAAKRALGRHPAQASPDRERAEAEAALAPHPLAQIKGRTFEVPGCGGFLMTGAAENIGDYLGPDAEAGIFGSAGELVALIRRYLGDESARARVADAGYRRTLAEHTYRLRFREIFGKMGFADEASIEPGEGRGHVEEIR